MMTRVNFEETFEIFLFLDDDLTAPISRLSEFVSFLKYNKGNPLYKFSYVGKSSALIPEMTLNENVLMDFSPDSLTAAREFQFQEFLDLTSNKELLRLYHKIGMPHDLPARTDAQMRKVAALIKALIFEGQFIFLERPELDLENETLEQFILALKEQTILKRQNVFISSPNKDLWLPHAHQLVTREKNFTFSTEKLGRGQEWKKERETFFALPPEGPRLQFIIPEMSKKSLRKKSAA